MYYPFIIPEEVPKVMTYGSGGGVAPSTPIITVATPSYSDRASPRVIASEVDRDSTIQELMDIRKKQIGNARALANDPYWKNLSYMAANPPLTRSQKEAKDYGLDDVIDAIFYASAIASVVPTPATRVGGMLGMSATNVYRAFATGNRQAQYRSVSNLSRNMANVYGYYKQDSQRNTSRISKGTLRELKS